MGQKLINLEKPLEQWNLGQLKFEVASLLKEPSYLIMLDYEKEDRKYPISREEMIRYLRFQGSYK